VFGVIYGSIAQPVMGATATMLSSFLIFSGSVQFTIIGLLSAGAGTAALIGGAATLNLRNLALGAVLRSRIDRPRWQRAGLGWFLTDEAVGLSFLPGADAARTLLTSGVVFYVAWQAGTALGLLGASLESVRSAAESVFPVLFIGLAAVTCASRSIAVRAVIAAAATMGALLLWPGSRGVVAVVAAIAVAIPGKGE
jgi:predicted branched-subunit amino acid permease